MRRFKEQVLGNLDASIKTISIGLSCLLVGSVIALTCFLPWEKYLDNLQRRKVRMP